LVLGTFNLLVRVKEDSCVCVQLYSGVISTECLRLHQAWVVLDLECSRQVGNVLYRCLLYIKTGDPNTLRG